MTVGDCNDGDVVRICGEEFRLMISLRGGFYARIKICEGRWSGFHRWVPRDKECEMVKEQRTGKEQGESVDPLMMEKKGTLL